MLCIVLLLFPNALQTSLYYYSAPCPSAFQHIPEMLYHNTLFNKKLQEERRDKRERVKKREREGEGKEGSGTGLEETTEREGKPSYRY
jgi:hypothetical protein